MKPNPNRPINPFKSHNKPDWISRQISTGDQESFETNTLKADSPTSQSEHDSFSRKAAPPIPKKPTTLTKPTELLRATELTKQAERLGEIQAQHVVANREMSNQTRTPQNILQHSTDNSSHGVRPNTEDGVDSKLEVDRPSLPPRANVNLMDHEEDDAKGIPSLKPLRLG